MSTFMNVRALIKQYGDHLRTDRSGDVMLHTVQEQALRADSETRAGMIIVNPQGETVNIYEIMEVCRKWQEYVRMVMSALARAAECDKTLTLSAADYGRLDQFSQFLQALETLKDFYANPTRYGKDSLKKFDMDRRVRSINREREKLEKEVSERLLKHRQEMDGPNQEGKDECIRQLLVLHPLNGAGDDPDAEAH